VGKRGIGRAAKRRVLYSLSASVRGHEGEKGGGAAGRVPEMFFRTSPRGMGIWGLDKLQTSAPGKKIKEAPSYLNPLRLYSAEIKLEGGRALLELHNRIGPKSNKPMGNGWRKNHTLRQVIMPKEGGRLRRRGERKTGFPNHRWRKQTNWKVGVREGQTKGITGNGRNLMHTFEE